jgi:hypothetical protein
LHSRVNDNGESASLLSRALAADPRSESAHWYSGHVYESGQWLKYDAVPDVDAHRRLVARYEAERQDHPDTLEGHVAMAAWCGEQRLTMQERAHWYKVLQISPDHAAARAHLGFVRVDDRWMARSDLENTRRRKFDAELAFKKWSTLLRPIRIAFESGDSTRIAAARQKLAAVRDPDAIPALETMLSRVNLEAASAVVLTIRQMKGPEAAIGLARQAMYADWYPAGKEASEALGYHDELSYVPLMLSVMSTAPGDSLRETRFSGVDPGRLLVRYEFERERHDRTEKVSYDVSYGVWSFKVGPTAKLPASAVNPRGLNIISPNGRVSRSMWARDVVNSRNYLDQVVNLQADGDRAEIAGWIEVESRTTRQLNGQICRALRTAVADLGPGMETDDPRTWWTWWTKRREVLPTPKPVVTSQFVREEPVYVPAAPPLTLPRPPGIPGMSCLVAGTTVYTDAGPRPIERIRLGDRVLSQNVETGELAYRAVLEPTVRPPASTVVLKFGDRTIRATGGHPFWAVGRGWTMAREFEPGMRMATIDGTAEVTGIEPAFDAPAYNLVVDEFHTYFVGDDRVLSHDNLPPQPTQGNLPGEAASH